MVSVAYSDAGRVRATNEDRFLALDNVGLWVVVDGMGGHRDGARAAQLVVDSMAAIVADTDEIRKAMQRANETLYTEGQASGTIGATVAALTIAAGHYTCYWAGDCRIYRLRDGALSQVTNDHSEVNRMVASGLLSRHEARTHPDRNIVTRGVGIDPTLDLDAVSGSIQAGDVFLLCTDGLSDALDERRLQALLRSACDDLAEAVVREAIECGSSDNVTAIIVRTR